MRQAVACSASSALACWTSTSAPTLQQQRVMTADSPQASNTPPRRRPPRPTAGKHNGSIVFWAMRFCSATKSITAFAGDWGRFVRDQFKAILLHLIVGEDDVELQGGRHFHRLSLEGCGSVKSQGLPLEALLAEGERGQHRLIGQPVDADALLFVGHNAAVAELIGEVPVLPAPSAAGSAE